LDFAKSESAHLIPIKLVLVQFVFSIHSCMAHHPCLAVFVAWQCLWLGGVCGLAVVAELVRIQLRKDRTTI